MQRGISVIVCCYNSAQRISRTLGALACQNIPPNMQYEIILVDNASSDDTSIIAAREWKSYHSDIVLTVVQENRKGLGYARRKGIAASRYDYIIFCDDDNWLSSNYISTAFEELEKDTGIAACGGHGIAVFEAPKPGWFDHFGEAFATGPQDVRGSDGGILWLYGAGLVVRKKVIEDLEKAGFSPEFVGRKGAALSSAEDLELTNAMVLMGYRLVYVPELVFYHYMPVSRMNAAYLRKLFISFGHDGPIRNLYNAYLQPNTHHGKVRSWYIHVCIAILRMCKYLFTPPKKRSHLIYFYWSLAYLRSLWQLRSRYAEINNNIKRIQFTSCRPPATGTNILSILLPTSEFQTREYQ